MGGQTRAVKARSVRCAVSDKHISAAALKKERGGLNACA